MALAKTVAGSASFQERNHSTVAAAKEEDVCPEGNENPDGSGMIIEIHGKVAKGLGRAIQGFRIRLVTTAVRSSAAPMTMAILRVFRKISRTAVRAIQSIPPFPSVVIIGMRKSKTGLCIPCNANNVEESHDNTCSHI